MFADSSVRDSGSPQRDPDCRPPHKTAPSIVPLRACFSTRLGSRENRPARQCSTYRSSAYWQLMSSATRNLQEALQHGRSGQHRLRTVRVANPKLPPVRHVGMLIVRVASARLDLYISSVPWRSCLDSCFQLCMAAECAYSVSVPKMWHDDPSCGARPLRDPSVRSTLRLMTCVMPFLLIAFLGRGCRIQERNVRHERPRAWPTHRIQPELQETTKLFICSCRLKAVLVLRHIVYV